MHVKNFFQNTNMLDQTVKNGLDSQNRLVIETDIFGKHDHDPISFQLV